MVTYKIQSRLKYLIYIIDLIGSILFYPYKLYNQRKKILYGDILVIKNDYIGDMILATPFFEQLKKKNPQCKLTVLCRSFSTKVIENNPYIDEIIICNTPWLSRRDSSGYVSLIKLLIKNYGRFDVVYDLHTEPRNILIGFFLGKSVIGYPNRGFGFLLTKSITNNVNTHIVEQNVALIGCDPVPPKIYLTSKEKSDAERYFQKFNTNKKVVGVHPGTSDVVRKWPPEKFNGLIKRIDSDYTILVFETDCYNASEIVKDTGAINLCGKLSIRSFFALVSLLDYMVCLESMAGHAASALNIPMTVIYSSTTNVNTMKPYGCTSVVQSKNLCNHCGEFLCIHNDSVRTILVEDVIKEIVL